MGRLLRDVRANTVTIMAIAIIPLAGMVGGGVDLSRMYIVKTRLQHACDAGALAGRKSMGGGTWNQSNYAPRTEAERFFNANIQASPYGATALTRSFVESAGKVTGTASATVPMTLMRIFGKTSQTLSVTCDAEMRLPNTDVMFVLDTTKSMVCAPSATQMYCSDAGSGSRMVGLRVAVKCFFEIVARLNTDANCTGGTPSGGTGDQVQIRFGFVPYATNVNVGKLLPTTWFADSANYQTRKVSSITYTYPNAGTPSLTGTTYNWNNPGSWSDKYTSVNASSSSQCAGLKPADTTPTTSGSQGNAYNTVTTPGPGAGVQTVTYQRNTTASKYTYQYDSYTTSGTDRCLYDRATVSGTKVDSYTRQDIGVPQVTWNYDSLPVTISLLKNGTTWNNSFQWPVADGGSNATINWDGCIEERQTVSTTNFSPIPAGAKDLDIDLVPNSEATRWKPTLPRAIFTRRSTGGGNTNANSWAGTSTSNWNTAQQTTTNDYGNGSSYSCPTEARKLQAWPDATAFDDYVDSLNPDGATYHDIGILWGARLMSPTGLFAAQNAFTPEGGEIERHMIFMTDGDTNANDYDYAAYGLPFFDHRQTGASPTKDQLDQQVNLRFLALCSAVKNKNITLWVISFGASVTSDSADRLEQCATSGRFFSAADSTALQTTFRSIADQISQLRLTK
ncbi:MAG: pilus assembly protein TadG-related protein [Sphingomonas sp.]